MLNEKQSVLKFCHIPQNWVEKVKDERGAPASHPQMTRVGLWAIISSKQGFFDGTKDLISVWECPLQGLSHKGWQSAGYDHNRHKTMIQFQARILGLGSGSRGTAARIAELHLHVWLIQPLLVSISKVGYYLCRHRIL